MTNRVRRQSITVSARLPHEAWAAAMGAFRSAPRGSILARMIHSARPSDDWHVRLLHALASDSRSVCSDEVTFLEIAFGQARTAIAYAVELARAHRIPAQGTTTGDDVWFQLGDWRTRVMLNRRERHLIARRPGQDEVAVRWDSESDTAVTDEGPVDVGALTRDGIDAVVAAWRAQLGSQRVETAPPRNTEDELTRS